MKLVRQGENLPFRMLLQVRRGVHSPRLENYVAETAFCHRVKQWFVPVCAASDYDVASVPRLEPWLGKDGACHHAFQEGSLLFPLECGYG